MLPLLKKAAAALLLCALLVSSASAYADYYRPLFPVAGVDPIVFDSTTAISYDAGADGYLIAEVEIRAPHPVSAQIQITDTAGVVHSGGINSIPSGWGSNISCWLGSNSSEYSPLFGSPSRTTWRLEYRIPSIYSESKGNGERYFALFRSDIPSPGKQSLTEINYAVRSITITSDQPVRVKIWVMESADVEESITDAETRVSGLVEFVKSLVGTIYTVVTLSWYIFSHYVCGNALLIFAAYESVALALSINRAADIFDAWARLIDYNKKLAEFVIWFVDAILRIIWTAIDAITFRIFG